MKTISVKTAKNKYVSDSYIDFNGKKTKNSITFREVKRRGFNKVIGFQYENLEEGGTLMKWIFE